MVNASKERVFARHDKVVAAVDLPFVPAGTPGKVMYVAGVTWFRYHVQFATGRAVSSLDATQLMAKRDWEAKQYQEGLAARKAVRQAGKAAATA